MFQTKKAFLTVLVVKLLDINNTNEIKHNKNQKKFLLNENDAINADLILYFTEKNYIRLIQDMLVPIEDLSKSLKMFDDEVAIYPIWLCPFKETNLQNKFRIFIFYQFQNN